MSKVNNYNDKGALYSKKQYFLTSLKVPLVLLILTLCSITISGVLSIGSEHISLSSVLEGISYALVGIIILGAHALGHYIQARLYGVKVSPPYFIPIPGFMGTVGAYTKMHWPISNRKTLVKIFATGPICGFIAAWIVLIIGLFFSKVVDTTSVNSSVKMGDSIIMHLTSLAILGNLPVTKDVMLHPLAYAGWLGLFYNFCHLLPIGKFDGGRLIYALWGYRVTVLVSFISIVGLLILGYFSSDWTSWFGLAIVGVISTIGFRGQYPSESYDQPLAKSMVILLSIIAAIFVVSFTPIPLPILTK
jgi:membrane-associated protease RseP (regulator of RpoE activity)